MSERAMSEAPAAARDVSVAADEGGPHPATDTATAPPTDLDAVVAAATAVDIELRWRTSPLAQTLFLCGAAALAAALVSGRWQLIAFAAPLLGVLCSVWWQRPSSVVSVRAAPTLLRCFEGERIETCVELMAWPAGSAAEVTVTGPPGIDIETPDVGTPNVEVPAGGGSSRRTVAVGADHWGRYPLRAGVEVVAAGGLLTASTAADVAELFVFPLVPPPSTGVPLTDLLDRLGTHLTRHIGPGVEYADIRPYVPGDQLRTVNWAVSARRGALHVTERLTDRAVDVVVLLDMSAQPPGPATVATRRTVEGAVQVVQSALRRGDRAGLVGLGGQQPRWLGPDIGQRQFYRVLDAALGAGAGYRTTAGTLAPRPAVPPGAVVVAFSSLLDSSFGLALADLAKRGHAVVVVDVLEGCPLEGDQEPILQRMWALQRSAMYRDMRMTGVDVVSWPSEVPLDHAMRTLPERRSR